MAGEELQKIEQQAAKRQRLEECQRRSQALREKLAALNASSDGSGAGSSTDPAPPAAPAPAPAAASVPDDATTEVLSQGSQPELQSEGTPSPASLKVPELRRATPLEVSPSHGSADSAGVGLPIYVVCPC